MQVIAELLLGTIVGAMLTIAEWTARIFFRAISFGWIRVQSSPFVPYKDEPEFHWYNIVWKTGAKSIWLSTSFAMYFGFFLWAIALTALVYCLRSFA